MLKRKVETLYDEYHNLRGYEKEQQKQITKIQTELKDIKKRITRKKNEYKFQSYKLQIYQKEFKELNFCDNIFNIIFEYSLICTIHFDEDRYYDIGEDYDEKFEIIQNDKDENYLTVKPPKIIDYSEEEENKEIHVYYFFGGLEMCQSALIITQEIITSAKKEITFPLNLNIFKNDFKMLKINYELGVHINNITSYFKENREF